MTDYIRRVRLTPYRKGMGPTFTLTIHGVASMFPRVKLSYTLTQRENGRVSTLFHGYDFGPSPMHCVDDDATIAALMGFLTLRPGDTEREYFKDYTPEQLAYCAQHAESLYAESERRFGEG